MSIMSIDLELTLQAVGFPTDPCQIVGRLYQFECQHGSHYGILVGTVQAVEISDEGGLDLYVSNPRFWGGQLISIKYSNGKWMVYAGIKPREWSDEVLELKRERVIAEDIAAKFFEGKFQLL